MLFTVVHNGRWRTPWARYLMEMLHTAGCLGWTEQGVMEGTTAGTIVLPACWFPPEEQNALSDFVAGGGTLIASRPPLTMAQVFGLKPTGRILREQYLRLSAHALVPDELQGLTLQCPSAMDLYDPAGGEVLAWWCDPLEGLERYPAIVAHAHGRGWAVAFTFDLADCLVRLHQGLISQASDQREGDPCGMGWAKPNDLFVSLLDARLRLVPQADVHQRLFVHLLETAAAQRALPLLRLWHLPGGVPALATFTGDSDGMKREHLEEVLSIIERQGGRYTLYLMEEHRDLMTPSDADALRRAGHGLGHHTWVGFSPTIADMREGARRQFDGFKERYGFQPLSHRGHCCIWVGWVEQGRILSENGVRLDSNHYPYVHSQYGFLSGSGQGFRFVDEGGDPLDLWEQPTLMSDDCMLQDKTFLPPFTLDQAIERSREMIDALTDRWHGVYHPCFHPVYMRTDWQYVYTAPWIEAVAAYCRERGVPMWSAEAWAAFVWGRRAVRLVHQEQQGGTLRCTLHARQAVPQLALLLPDQFRGASVDGVPTPPQKRILEGRERLVVAWDMPADVPVSLVLSKEEKP
ncbi:MAG: hypothetical protein NZT92_04835 [Abditibacteriales bacterium]|nr:hypothetical protein [Abditibacteriales bacterium]MDW8365252.1 hypothetical protein [Abditibacteriales bacterium]